MAEWDGGVVTAPTAFDDARKFLDMRAAGWTDPEVDPIAMIAELVEASDTYVPFDEHEFAVEDAHTAGVDEGAEKCAHWLDPGSASVESLLEALATAAARVTIAAERDLLRAEVANMFRAGDTPPTPAKPKRPRRSRSKFQEIHDPAPTAQKDESK